MGRNSRQTRETSIVQLADGHHRSVTRERLVAAGLSDDAIARRPWLHRTYRGVYTVGGPPRTALERAAAAVLACGRGAALSHRSALALWGLGKWPSLMHVTVPGDSRQKGIIIHRPTGLIGRDFRRHQDIRVTSPARTLLDCAPTLADKALRRAYNDARRSEQMRLRPHHVTDVLERFPNHHGARRLKALLSVKGGPTRLEWEDAFPAFCKRYGLPEPVMSTFVAGHEVDALFAEETVIVELDSWEFHQDRESFESDRDRDADTLAADHVTVRITWERIHGRGAREAQRLHAILRQRRMRAA